MGKKPSKVISGSRRDFLKLTAAGAAGIALTSKVDSVFASSSAVTSPGAGNKWPGRVVINFNKNAVSSSGTADTAVIKKMVDDSILKLTGETTVAAAWKAIFPSSSLSATSKLAIKIPIGFNDGLSSPHWSSVQAIVEGLKQMDFNGTKFPASNITIYDMYGSGSFSTAGYTAANFPGVTIVKDSLGTGYSDGARSLQYATKLKAADFLINVFSPRGHLSFAGNFTLGFKCHYGTYPDPSTHHDTNAQQYLRDINCTGPVYNKNVLSVCSGIYGQNESNGPSGSPDNYSTYSKYMDSTSASKYPTTIIMSTDPVSCEMQAIKIMRINNGKGYTANDMPNYLKSSGGMTVSGFTPIDNIGTIDESKMTIGRILNGTSPVLNSLSNNGMAGGPAIAAHQIKGHNSTFIEFRLPHEHAGGEAAIEIFNIHGALVRKFSHKVLGVLNNLSWDEKDIQGAMVSKGSYVVRLVAGSVQASTQCMIVR